jgi:hypothetical protein
MKNNKKSLASAWHVIAIVAFALCATIGLGACSQA